MEQAVINEYYEVVAKSNGKEIYTCLIMTPPNGNKMIAEHLIQILNQKMQEKAPDPEKNEIVFVSTPIPEEEWEKTENKDCWQIRNPVVMISAEKK